MPFKTGIKRGKFQNIPFFNDQFFGNNFLSRAKKGQNPM